jgi:hypothetical protein
LHCHRQKSIACVSIALDSLVICLQQNQFTYDEESRIISCTICTSEEAIRRNVSENNMGHFKVNIDKYDLEKFTKPNQQPTRDPRIV